MNNLAEVPTVNVEKDLLGFATIAQNIVSTIKNKNIIYKDTDGIKKGCNIGLYGEWGSGKTSIIGMVKELARKEYIFIDFNAWAYKNSDEIIDVLLEKISKNNLLQKIKTTFYAVLKYILLLVTAFWLSEIVCRMCFSFSSLILLIPRVNIVLPVLLFFIFLMLPGIFGKAKLPSYLGTLQDLFRLSDKKKKIKLKKLSNKKIFIIILDDIDRSPKFEDVPNIFTKLSDLFGIENFNFIFLLDRDKVELSLKKAGNSLWDIEFINKFIDFHFYIPVMTTDSKKYFLKKILTEDFRKNEIFTEDFLIKNADSFPNNPRQIKTILRDLLEREVELKRFFSFEIDKGRFLLSIIFKHIAGDLFYAIKCSTNIKTKIDIIVRKNQDEVLNEQKEALEILVEQYCNKKSANYFLIKELTHKIFDGGKYDDFFIDYSDNSKTVIITTKEFDNYKTKEEVENFIINKNVAFALRDIINICNMYEMNIGGQTLEQEMRRYKRKMLMSLEVGKVIVQRSGEWTIYATDLIKLFFHNRIFGIGDQEIISAKKDFLNAMLDKALSALSLKELRDVFDKFCDFGVPVPEPNNITPIIELLKYRIKQEYKNRMAAKYKTFNNDYPNTKIELSSVFDLVLEKDKAFLEVLSDRAYLESVVKNCDNLFFCINKYYGAYFYDDKKYTKREVKKVIILLWKLIVSDELSQTSIIHFMRYRNTLKDIFDIKEEELVVTEHIKSIREEYNKTAAEKI